MELEKLQTPASPPSTETQSVASIRDAELARVLSGVVVRVANEGCLEMVADLAVADGDEVSGVREVNETVVEVLAAVQVAG